MESGLDRNPVPDEADYGAPLDEEWLRGITFVGFSDDAVPDSGGLTIMRSSTAVEANGS